MSTRAHRPARNTQRQDELITQGRGAAFAGIGLTDRDELLATLLTEVGPYALMERSAWLVGHENGCRELDNWARQSAIRALGRALRDAGFGFAAAGRSLLISGPGTALIVEAKSAPTLAEAAETAKDYERSTLDRAAETARGR